MWSYLLGHAIALEVREGQASIMHHFAYVVAIPGLYDQVIAHMAPGVPDTVFMDPATSTATFMRFSNTEALALNFGRDEVLHHLILNR